MRVSEWAAGEDTMHLSRVQIRNFRNFENLDVSLGGDILLVGPNRVGKSNFIFALRLVLDATLPDAARQLKTSDIWDGCELSSAPEVRVEIDVSGFDADPNLVALLTDFRLPSDHTVARLTYAFRKRLDIAGEPRSDSDYEFATFGGDDETRPLRNELRRRICLDVMHALRDAEGELRAWRSSPLRAPLDQGGHPC